MVKDDLCLDDYGIDGPHKKICASVTGGTRMFSAVQNAGDNRSTESTIIDTTA